MFGRRREIPPPPFDPVTFEKPPKPEPKAIPPYRRWAVHYIGDAQATMVDAHRMEFDDGVAIFTTFTESTWQWSHGWLGPLGWSHHFKRTRMYVGGFRNIVPIGPQHGEDLDE